MPKMYWTADTEAALIEYNRTEDMETRNRIYEEKLHYPFSKLVENVVNTFKFPFIQGNVYHDALSFVVSKADKFDPSKGAGKSFGFFSITAKRYLILLNTGTYKENLRSVQIASGDDLDECEGDNVVLSYEDGLHKSFDYSEYAKALIEFFNKYINRLFKSPRDRNLAHALIGLFTDPPNELHKKALVAKIRQATGCTAAQLNAVAKRMRRVVKTAKRQYLECGFIRSPKCPICKSHVDQICELIATGKYSITEVGTMLGMSRDLVSRVISGKAYRRWLPDGWNTNRKKRFGQFNCKAKLTTEQVLSIHAEYRAGTNVSDLAKKYRVNRVSIEKLLKGVTWGHLSEQAPPLKRLFMNGLNEGKIQEIYLAYQRGEKMKAIAARLGTTINVVYRIKTRQTYADITEPLLPAQAPEPLESENDSLLVAA